MPLTNTKNSNQAKTIALYNMIPNLLWSIINLTPISVYCFTLLDYKVFYIFLAISLSPVFFKNSFLDKLQIGRTTKVYKLFGVHLVNHVTQNGVIINRLIKRKFPEHKVVTTRRLSISRLIDQTYKFEKFHLIFFLFFCLTIAYALMKGHLRWASLILLTNIVYNIYPNLLQQYIRLKLVLFSKKIDRNEHPLI